MNLQMQSSVHHRSIAKNVWTDRTKCKSAHQAHSIVSNNNNQNRPGWSGEASTTGCHEKQKILAEPPAGLIYSTQQISGQFTHISHKNTYKIHNKKHQNK